MLKEDKAVAQSKLVEEWRDRLSRQQSSGQSIVAFCRKEGITEGQFYGWRSRLRKRDAKASPILPITEEVSPFIEIGSINPIGIDETPSSIIADHKNKEGNRLLEVRIELGHGVVLQILRH